MMRLVIVDGGPAGVEAAKTAALFADVTLVAAEPVGSWRPVATRVWLTAVAAGERDVTAIAAQAARVAAAWQERCAAELSAMGVMVVTGRGRLGIEGEVLVEDNSGSPPHRLAADVVILAGGATGSFPAALAPDGERICTDADLATLTAIPGSALVLGDGPVGFELCHILSLLGSEVSWLVPHDQPQSWVASEADTYLTRLLEGQGVRVIPGALARELARDREAVIATTTSGAQHRAELALLAFGRRPDLQALGLAADEAAALDHYGQTKRRGVYLVGDALAPRAASVAMVQARAAALHAVERAGTPADTQPIVLSFMHRPHVAALGRVTGAGVQGSVTLELAESLAAHMEAATEGFLTFAWDHEGRVAGAVAVAADAAAILAPVAMAMRAGMSLGELAASYGPHPSVSELGALAARKAQYEAQLYGA